MYTRLERIKSSFVGSKGKGKWQLWVEAEAGAGIARDLRFDEIVVPTNSTIRNRHLISLLVKRGAFVALVGETTSAKTTAITVSMMRPSRPSRPRYSWRLGLSGQPHNMSPFFHLPCILFCCSILGCTLQTQNFFETRLDRKAYEPVSLNFTANACSDTIQRSIGCKLEKRKKGRLTR